MSGTQLKGLCEGVGISRATVYRRRRPPAAGRLRPSAWVHRKTDRPHLATGTIDGVEPPIGRLTGHWVACTLAERDQSLACGHYPKERSAVPGIRRALAVASEGREICAIDRRGEVICAYIRDVYGEETATVVPSVVPKLRGAERIAAGSNYFCAVVRGGDVRCWRARGATVDTAAGPVRLEIRLGDVEPTGIANVAAIAGNHLGFATLDAEGQLRSWDPADPETATPSPTIDATIVELVAGAEHFCARDEGGAVTCWGVENRGQLGRLPPEVHLTLTPLVFAEREPGPDLDR